MGIRAKLFFCLLAVLIPLCAVSMFAFHLFDKQLRERTESALANTQRLEASRISEILSGYARDARNLATEPQLRKLTTEFDKDGSAFDNNSRRGTSTPQASDDSLQSISIGATSPLQQLSLELQNKARSTGSAIADLKIVNREGMTLGQTANFTWQPADYTLVEHAMTTVKTRFGDAFLTNAQQRLGAVSPIVSELGEVVGALLLETPLHPITDVVSMHERRGLTTEALIVQKTSSGDAQLITALRFDRTSAFSKIIPSSKNLPLNQALDSNTSTIVKAPDYRGVNSVSSIQTISATGWGLVVKIDEQEAYAPLDKLRKILGAATAVSLLLILMGYTIFLGPIARRLKKTAHAAHKIMHGDLTARVCDDANDEIGNTARTIDSLALQLEQDQRKRMQVEEQLRYQATHDELTGLSNRKYANKLIEALNTELALTHSVMFLDLNGFKDVNDFYGHAVGDEVLRTVADRLVNATPNNATLARWGGDEFVIILPETDLVSAQIFCTSIHTALDTLIPSSAGNHEISTSIGLAASTPGKSLREALIEADALMYKEKKSRKSDRTISSMAAKTLERALLEKRIELWYEPIVKCDAQGGEKIVAADVKIRIRTSEGGIVLPEEVLNGIEHTHLAATLYSNAFSACSKSLSRWIDTKIVSPEFKLHFGIITGVPENRQFTDSILQFIRTDGRSIAKNITLFTQSISNIDNDALLMLKEEGLSIATMHSGILTSSIKSYEPHQPDITKVGITNFDDESLAPQLIEDLKKHDVRICVYGISNRDQLSKLTPMGIRFYQGKLFDRPLRAVDFISRWGQPSENNLVPLTHSKFKLGLAG